jgi:tRNA G18 (ribose-2'-O)-methylase SpoU
VRRLLASRLETISVVCTSAALEWLRPIAPPGLAVYVGRTSLLSRLVGFRFHRGVLAAGRVPPPADLRALVTASSARSLVVVCPEIRDPVNLGAIVRTSAALGATCLVTGPDSTHPFSRRVLRTSMGGVLRLPVVQTECGLELLTLLHGAGYESVAAVVDPQALALSKAPRHLRAAIFLGNEDRGLPVPLERGCRTRVTVPMPAAGDSLNVAVAAGIVLYHYASKIDAR